MGEEQPRRRAARRVRSNHERRGEREGGKEQQGGWQKDKKDKKGSSQKLQAPPPCTLDTSSAITRAPDGPTSWVFVNKCHNDAFRKQRQEPKPGQQEEVKTKNVGLGVSHTTPPHIVSTLLSVSIWTLQNSSLTHLPSPRPPECCVSGGVYFLNFPTKDGRWDLRTEK